jgi:hypothetical protein
MVQWQGTSTPRPCSQCPRQPYIDINVGTVIRRDAQVRMTLTDHVQRRTQNDERKSWEPRS